MAVNMVKVVLFLCSFAIPKLPLLGMNYHRFNYNSNEREIASQHETCCLLIIMITVIKCCVTCYFLLSCFFVIFGFVKRLSYYLMNCMNLFQSNDRNNTFFWRLHHNTIQESGQQFCKNLTDYGSGVKRVTLFL